MAINPSYLPESVAFKRLMRELIRQANYVPPYQERTQPTVATPADVTRSAPDEQTMPRLPGLQLGEWTLTTNDRGDVIWRHTSGYEQIAAQLPEGDTDG